MSFCDFPIGVPVGLAAATKLRHLILEYDSTAINLTAADIAVLRFLPALATFACGGPMRGFGKSVWLCCVLCAL